jgi:glycosyltransferase involved in cell wall biosynthesis
MPGDRPRIVFLTPVLPVSQGNGLAMRAGLFLEGMSRRNDVAVAVVPAFGPPPREGDFVTDMASSRVTLELADPADARTWSILLGTPAGRQRARELYPLPALCPVLSPGGHDELRRLTEAAGLVHVMRSYLAPCVDFVLDDDADDATRPPATLDLDELDSDVQRQLGHDQDAERFERLLRHYAPRFDQIYLASDDDARTVRRRYGVERVRTVANAVRAPAAGAQSEPVYDLLFVGNLSYQPNIDAASWLCDQVRPLLGEVTIAIVGGHPGPEVSALAEIPGVTVAGDVPEVTSWYRRSRIAVAPLRIGGGTRIKIVEALAHERPVVSTPIGASGLAVGERNGIVIAETAAEFAAACRALLDDTSAAVRIAAAGRSQVTMAEQVVETIDGLTRSAILATCRRSLPDAAPGGASH